MDDVCGEVLRELQVYLDGECSGPLGDVIRAHLGDCPPCIDRVDFEREVRVLIASRCRDSAPTDLVQRIMGSLRFGTGA
ncbi:MAG TPA: mycothiol system anti-sigma-R factor [Egibacteraceae bacterium]|nr:mycothiol system anti-sigma-R factor [Egibacteraceae bacterium]